MYSNSKEAKEAGWFSRRHQTSTACEASRRTEKSRKDQRREDAEARAAIRAERTDHEQLEVLRQRGVTFGREVERLNARIAAERGTV